MDICCRSSRPALRELCALLTAIPLLNGCAAAALAPMVAGAGMAGAGQGDAPQIVQDPSPMTDPLPGSHAPSQDASDVATTALLTNEDLVAWRAFVEFALARSRALEVDDVVLSAVLVPLGSPSWPARMECEAREPAVMLDIDAGPTPFTPDLPQQAAPGLAAALALLRSQGFVILWTSSADANRVAEIAEALRISGLDPTGRDPLLLVRNDQERKQVMRRDAAESVCVLAIAGDRRSDFDEGFDYLRVPASQVGLEQLLGRGWFLTPAPLVGAK